MEMEDFFKTVGALFLLIILGTALLCLFGLGVFFVYKCYVAASAGNIGLSIFWGVLSLIWFCGGTKVKVQK